MRAFIFGVLLVLTVCLVAQVMPSSRRIVAPTPAAAGGGACATSDTTLPHDELLEGWEGDGTENTWAFSGVISGITATLPLDSSALATGKPTGACGQALQFAVEAESTSNSYYTWDRGSAVATNVSHDLVFYIWPVTAPVPGEAFRIISQNDNANPTLNLQWYISIRADTGPITGLQATGSTSTSTSGTDGNLTADQWNKVAIHNENTDTSSTMTINDGTPLSFQRNSSGVRYVHVGVVGAIVAGEGATYVLDLLAWNTP